MKKCKLILTISVILVIIFGPTELVAQNPESRFLISVDKDADIYIDNVKVGSVNVGEFKMFTVFPGDHYVEAKSLDGAWMFKQIASVNPNEQKILNLKLSSPTDSQIGIVGSFTDLRDQNKYKTVNINGKTWLAENLKYQTSNSVCYKNSNEHCLKFGRHYSLDDARIACPSGWHLPSQEEWENLLKFYPGSDVSYLFQGGKSNFNAIFGGATYRYSRNIALIEDDRGDDVFGVFWANAPDETRDRNVNGVVLYLSKDETKVTKFKSKFLGRTAYFFNGTSVRCVMN